MKMLEKVLNPVKNFIGAGLLVGGIIFCPVSGAGEPKESNSPKIEIISNQQGICNGYYPGPKSKIAINEKNLWMVNTDGSKFRNFFSRAPVEDIKFSPDGKYIAALGEGNIMIMDSENRAILNFIGADYYKGKDFSWTPDGKSILLGRYSDGIYRYDIQDKTEHKVITSPYKTYDHNPVMSPNLEKIVFTHHEWGSDYWIITINSDGSGLKEIARGKSEHDKTLDLNWVDNEHVIWRGLGDLTFSDKEYVTSETGINLDRIYYCDIKTAKTKKINLGVRFYNMKLSPDKKTIAVEGPEGICLIDTKELGSGKARAKKTGLGGIMDWSHDGNYFVRVNHGSGDFLEIYDKEGNQYKFWGREDMPENFNGSLVSKIIWGK